MRRRLTTGEFSIFRRSLERWELARRRERLWSAGPVIPAPLSTPRARRR